MNRLRAATITERGIFAGCQHRLRRRIYSGFFMIPKINRLQPERSFMSSSFGYSSEAPTVSSPPPQYRSMSEQMLRKPSDMLLTSSASNRTISQSSHPAYDNDYPLDGSEHGQFNDIYRHHKEQSTAEDLNRMINECKVESAWLIFQQLCGYSDTSEETTVDAHTDYNKSSLSCDQLLQLLDTLAKHSMKSSITNSRIKVLVATIRQHQDFHDHNRLLIALADAQQFQLINDILDDYFSSQSSASYLTNNSSPQLPTSSPTCLIASNTFSVLINRLIAGGQTENAMSLFKKIRSLGVPVDGPLFSAFITGFAALDDTKSARLFIEAKEQSGLSVSIHDFLVVLEAMFRTKCIEDAEKWYEKFLKPMIRSHTASVSDTDAELAVMTALVRGYGRAGNLEKARECFRYFKQRCKDLELNSKSTSVVRIRKVWSMMLLTYASSGMVDETTALFRQMRQSGVEPDVHSCDALILAFCRNNDIEMAKSIFDNLSTWKLKPTKITYTILVDACMKNGKIEEALRWIDRMKSEECAADVVFFTTLVDGYSKHGMYGNALEVYEDMKRTGVPLDIVACTSLLFGSAKRGDYECTLRVYQDIKDRGLQLTDYTYNALMIANGNNGDIDNVESLFEEMKSRGIPVNIDACNALISSYIRVNQIQKAYDVVREIKELKLQPTVTTYCLLMKIASVEGRCDSILKYLNTLIKDRSVSVISDRLVRYTMNLLGLHGHVEIVKMTFNALLNGDTGDSSSSTAEVSKKIEIREGAWQKFIEVMIAHEQVEEAKKMLIEMMLSKQAQSWLDDKRIAKLLEPFRQNELWPQLDEIIKATLNQSATT